MKLKLTEPHILFIEQIKMVAKKKKDSPLSYGIDELKDGYQGDQEEIYRLDRNASKSYKYWVTPEDELINIGDELHNNWALKNKGDNAHGLLINGWIRITDEMPSGDILFQLPDLNSPTLSRVDKILSQEPELQNFAGVAVGTYNNYYGVEMDDVLQFGTERALRVVKRQLNLASKGNKMAREYKLNIPMNFLEKYFFHTLDSQEFNNVKDQLLNTLEKNEHYFLDLGADPKEIVQLESEAKMAQTPGIFDTILEKMYDFGNKHGVWFSNTLMKGSAVTPARMFHKLLTAWKTADSPNWVPKIDRQLENVSIEFSDSTKMSIFDDKSVDMFLTSNKKKAGKIKPNKVKKISYSEYKTNLVKYLFNKLGNYSVSSEDIYKLSENWYQIASEALTERQMSIGTKDKTAFNKVSFETLAKHLDDHNTQLGHSLYSDTDVIILKTSENVYEKGTDSENVADEELLLINATVTALKNRGFDITAEDYIEWMSGSHTTNEGAERFDEVVIDLLGEQVYTIFKRLNCLNAKVRFELGVGPMVCDGVDLTMDPEFSETVKIDGDPIQSGEPTIVFFVEM